MLHATPVTRCAAGLPEAGSTHSCHRNPGTNGNQESCTAGKCIPDGANGCQRAALFKSTCCTSGAVSTPGIYQLRPKNFKCKNTQCEWLQKPHRRGRIWLGPWRTHQTRSCSKSSSRSSKSTQPTVSLPRFGLHAFLKKPFHRSSPYWLPQ